MNHAIEIDHLTKSYGNHTVLKGLSFNVHQGECFALLGVNGAGKTTTLECMEGLRRYDSGSVVINGRVGIQLQNASLPAHMRAAEALQLFSKWNRQSARADADARCVLRTNAALERVHRGGGSTVEEPLSGKADALGIAAFAKKQYGQLSTGQKRRLHLALALTRDPEILFLDEPTAGLDVEGRIALHEQIRRLKEQGKTLVLASHDMAEVESLCDRIAILAGGEIAFIGTVDELNVQAGKRYHILIKTKTDTERFESDHIGETLLALLYHYRETGAEILDIQIDRGSLEQHFMKIAGGK